MREWGKTMGCDGAKIQMISDGNTELSKVTVLLLHRLLCCTHGFAALIKHALTYHQQNDQAQGDQLAAHTPRKVVIKLTS